MDMTRLKTTLAVLGAAAALGGCAAGQYYDSYGYNPNYNYDAYTAPGPYYETPAYEAPAYYGGPAVGFGFSYTDRDRRDYRSHEWHGDRAHGDWHGGDHDRGDWRDDHGQRSGG
jgi:hypothetical protein